MLISSPTRRFASVLSLAVALGVLFAALLGPAQTLAQTRKLVCPGSTAHSRTKRGAHACLQASHKRKTHHARGHHAKHAVGVAGETVAAAVPASCEDGSVPVPVTGGSFSCSDGSEPECEDGATPTRSANGKSLLCPLATEEESEAGEAECEEDIGNACAADTISGSGEQSCETTSGSASSFVCETES